MTIEQLIKEEKQLRLLLSENLAKQKALNGIAFIEENGFKIGDKIEWTEGKKKKTGVISRIDSTGTIPYYYMANLFNSNGEVGKREVRIWRSDLSSVKKID